MNGELLDTSVLSLLTPGRPPVPLTLQAKLRGDAGGIFICAITLMEIQQGIMKLRRTGSDSRATLIERWLVDSISRFGDRILDFDAACAREAGRLSDAATSKGRHPGFPDIAIAATAQVYGLTILTRNLKHFVPLNVPCLDPFETPG
ncbi:MAG: type II toxin-antitoxin system VapC family toxin [Devosia sp.]